MADLWPFLLVVALGFVGFPLATRWRRRHPDPDTDRGGPT